VDPLICPKCGSEMKCSFGFAKLPASAVILDAVEIKRILRYLAKIGRSPPRVDKSSLN
jgi:hypothetical protein